MAAFVTSDRGTHSHRRYHMSALLNADVTLNDGPYSIVTTLGASYVTMAQNGAVTGFSLARRWCLTPCQIVILASGNALGQKQTCAAHKQMSAKSQ